MITFEGWLLAFLITQLIEVPIYLLASVRTLGWPKACIFAFGASALTHPVLWFAIPWDSLPYNETVIIAEIGVFLVEAIWATSWRVPHGWLWALGANLTSLAIGLWI